jgi:Aspartyl protease
MRARLGLTILFAAALMRVAAAGTVAGEEFPFHLDEGFIWVKVRVPESPEPLNFLLDSGASVSVINLRTAEKAGFKLGKRVGVEGVGARAEGFWPQDVSATAGAVRLPEKYLAVDLSELSGSCACRVDGLIGADFFRGRIVQIDFAAGKVRLLAAAPASVSQEALPLKVGQRALRVPVRVNGGAARWARLDTGCASSLHWVTDDAESPAPARRVAVALTKVSVGVARTRVQLGGACFEGVATDLHPEAILAGEAGLLGNGLLSRFRSVTIDWKSGRVLLERSTSGAKP